MFTELKSGKRVLIEAELKPIQGDRFQPTGFADLGSATYQLSDGTQMLLVESAQSIANRLEATIIGPNNELIKELEGLSYIRVRMEGASCAETNSLIEAHRINSPFIISNEEFQQEFKKEADYTKGKALDWRKIARTVFKYDINSILHGVFMANVEDGRVKLARSVSGFIEASGVREVVSGGVKNNPIDPTGKLRAKGFSKKNVYGNVPYQRVEYTAKRIVAYFNIDLGLLRSYDLGSDATDLLIALALFKIKRFLDGGLRLRTACNFSVIGGIKVTEPEGVSIPDQNTLLEIIQQKIQEVKDMFAVPPVKEILTEVVQSSNRGSNDTGE